MAALLRPLSCLYRAVFLLCLDMRLRTYVFCFSGIESSLINSRPSFDQLRGHFGGAWTDGNHSHIVINVTCMTDWTSGAPNRCLGILACTARSYGCNCVTHPHSPRTRDFLRFVAALLGRISHLLNALFSMFCVLYILRIEKRYQLPAEVRSTRRRNYADNIVPAPLPRHKLYFLSGSGYLCLTCFR